MTPFLAPYLALAKNTARSILEKHLLFAFSNKYIQDIFTVNGWSSTLKGGDNRKEEAGIINDFLGINEANLGVNKANFFVERSFFHNVDIGEEGRISETVKIEYQNSSKSWPGGDYVNYLRLILPINTTLLSISIDNVSQELVSAITDFRVYEAKNFVKPLGLEVERYDQDGKTIYGFLVDVKAGNSKSIEIKYNLSQKISIGLTDFSYSLRVFKQPGIENYPYSFSLTYPKNLRVVNGSDSSFLDIATDKEINLDFAQK